MIGICLDEPKVFEMDSRFYTFKLRLPHPNRKKNIVNVLLRQDYDYIPNTGDTIRFEGNLVSYDLGPIDGTRLFVSVVMLYKYPEEIKPEDNLIKIHGVVRKKEELAHKPSGKIVHRFTVLPLTNTGNKIPVYCVSQDSVAEATSEIELGSKVALQGRLVTRYFKHRNNDRRETTEFIVNTCYVQGGI